MEACCGAHFLGVVLGHPGPPGAFDYGLSKRGNPYRRRLFIHGARSVAMHLNREQHSIGTWMKQLESRAHRNAFVVALANKLARIAWAVVAKEETYRAYQ